MSSITVPVKKIEQVFTVGSLIFFTDPIALYRFISDVFLGGRFNTRSLLWSIVVTMTVLFLGLRFKKIVYVIKKNKTSAAILVVLLLFIVLSCLWSASPSLSYKRFTSLFLVSLFGIYFATRFELEEQLRLLSYALFLCTFLSVIMALLLPEYGIMGMGKELAIGGQEAVHEGIWRGIYSHKNPLGRIMALSGLALFLFASDKSNRKWAWLGFALSIGILLASQSATALCILITCSILTKVYQNLRWDIRLMVPLSIITVVTLGGLMTLVASNTETILNALGRDVTLSGRTELWSAVLSEIWQSPWLGYGYKGYWVGWNGPSAVIWSQFPWLPPHAHNGVLNVWLELGVLGLLLFTASFVFASAQAVIYVRETKLMYGLFPVIYLTFYFLFNLTESALIGDNIFWVLYISTFLLKRG